MRTGNYLIAHPLRIRFSDLFSFVLPRRFRSTNVLECPESIRLKVNESWRIKLSLILMKLINDAAVPLAKLGTWIEFYLNLLSQNGGLLKTLFWRLTGNYIVMFISSTPTFIVLKT